MRTPILRRHVARWGTAVLTAALSTATALPAEATGLPHPPTGQAALSFDRHGMISGPVATPHPMAGLTMVMTAYQVLLDHPLRPGSQGLPITVLPSEVTAFRTARLHGESTVPVAAGERISERAALEAMLLPSGDDMARILARWDAGSIGGFVARENTTAAGLGMRHTHYADPAGVDVRTSSTASDQLQLDRSAMANPELAGIVGEKSATVPVAGTVRNSDPLLGTDGFVGLTTGSTTAAGVCLMFAAREPDAHGGVHMVYGVLLGQPGRPSSRRTFDWAVQMVNAARAVLSTAR